MSATDEDMKYKTTIHSFLSTYVQENNIDITNEALVGISEIILLKSRLIGRDLELFAKHGKRQTITLDDVKLVCRNNPDLLKKS